MACCGGTPRGAACSWRGSGGRHTCGGPRDLPYPVCMPLQALQLLQAAHTPDQPAAWQQAAACVSGGSQRRPVAAASGAAVLQCPLQAVHCTVRACNDLPGTFRSPSGAGEQTGAVGDVQGAQQRRWTCRKQEFNRPANDQASIALCSSIWWEVGQAQQAAANCAQGGPRLLDFDRWLTRQSARAQSQYRQPGRAARRVRGVLASGVGAHPDGLLAATLIHGGTPLTVAGSAILCPPPVLQWRACRRRRRQRATPSLPFP